MTDALPFLETKSLSVGYRSKKGHYVVAESLDLHLYGGQMVCLLGANGSGKSTLLRTIAGLQPPLSGNVHLMQVPVHEIRPALLAKSLSLVLTDRVDTGNLTVRELIAIGRTPHTGWLGQLNASDLAKTAEAAELTQVTHLLDRRLHELSDGERQKVMLGRALAQDTPLILLDEPTAHLDITARIEMMVLLKSLARQTQKAILLSTHDFDLALRTADELWLLGKNKSLAAGAPEDLVLNGAFEKAFSKPGFTFNAVSGTFNIARPPARIIASISGDAKLVFWTKRAFEREGIAVAEHELADFQVFAEMTGDQPIWKVFCQEKQTVFQTIKTLVAFIQNPEIWL